MIENANNKQVAVFKLTASARNKYVIAVNITIPDTKERNLPGPNSP